MSARIRGPVFVLLLFAAAGLVWADGPSGTNDSDLAAVVGGNNRFAFDLYGRLALEDDGNLFVSPYSISTALGMTYAGARGNTEAQMADVLHFTLPQQRLHPAMGQVISNLNAEEREGYELSVANRLWGQEGYYFRPEFSATTRDHYGAELAELDFIGHTEQARETINGWVEEQTHEKIKDLIPKDVLSAATRLVLTNAIYFLGDWELQFDADLTEISPFTVAPQQQIDVSMMHQVSGFKYAALPECQILEMPYAGGDLSMLALLPNEVDGLAELEQSLSAERLDEWVGSLRSREVSVFLPKFEMTSEFSLAGMLASMGMPEAFGGAADFSGMTGSRGLFISAVIHKAFINLDEEGTEAAAATAVVVGITSEPPPPAVFRADHPFAFLIRDNETGSILFMGRVVEPEASSSAAVPEPSTLVLLATGAVGLLAYAWRRRKRAGSAISRLD